MAADPIPFRIPDLPIPISDVQRATLSGIQQAIEFVRFVAAVDFDHRTEYVDRRDEHICRFCYASVEEYDERHKSHCVYQAAREIAARLHMEGVPW